MYAVIFEVMPTNEGKPEYLELAAGLRDFLKDREGFISIERFESLVEEGKLLSLSFWEDEASIEKWRNLLEHRHSQKQGKEALFSDYRIRVAQVVRDYTSSERENAPDDSNVAFSLLHQQLTKVEVVDYDPLWAEQFELVTEYLREIIGECRIEHVGSTSVPNLAAKPILDVDIVYESTSDFPQLKTALETAGYAHRGNLGIVGREMFQAPSNCELPTFNLYVCQSDNLALRNHLQVRDYLCANSDAVEQYSNLKRRLAAEFPDDIDAYCQAKTEFILEMLAQCNLSDDELAEIKRQNVEPLARKNYVYIATSLDGYIATESGGVEWLDDFAPDDPNEDYGFGAFLEKVDAVLMGNNTFKQVLSFGVERWAYTKPVVVVGSNRISIPKILEGKVGYCDLQNIAPPYSPESILNWMHQRGFNNLYIDGGELIQQFICDGLIDELIITRIPILLGKGIPLFGVLENNVKLQHLETNVLDELVMSKYQIRNGS